MHGACDEDMVVAVRAVVADAAARTPFVPHDVSSGAAGGAFAFVAIVEHVVACCIASQGIGSRVDHSLVMGEVEVSSSDDGDTTCTNRIG